MTERARRLAHTVARSRLASCIRFDPRAKAKGSVDLECLIGSALNFELAAKSPYLAIVRIAGNRRRLCPASTAHGHPSLCPFHPGIRQQTSGRGLGNFPVDRVTPVIDAIQRNQCDILPLP